MQFIDLKAQQARIRDKVESRIQNVLDHGKYILGPEVSELEERLAGHAGIKHYIGCSSGTSALFMALMAWQVGPGDAVFVPAFSFSPLPRSCHCWARHLSWSTSIPSRSL